MKIKCFSLIKIELFTVYVTFDMLFRCCENVNEGCFHVSCLFFQLINVKFNQPHGSQDPIYVVNVWLRFEGKFWFKLFVEKGIVNFHLSSKAIYTMSLNTSKYLIRLSFISFVWDPLI